MLQRANAPDERSSCEDVGSERHFTPVRVRSVASTAGVPFEYVNMWTLKLKPVVKFLFNPQSFL